VFRIRLFSRPLQYLFLIKIEKFNLVKLPDSGHSEGSQRPSQFHEDDLHGGVQQEGSGRGSWGGAGVLVGGVRCGLQRMLASIVHVIIWAAASMAKDTHVQNVVGIEGRNRIFSLRRS
jgi:hypothetical protein